MSTVYFYPSLRVGAASALTTPDNQGNVTASPTVTAYATIAGEKFQQTVRLAGPGEVVGLDAALFGRRYPEEGAKDAELAHFPLVELTEPDLPWRYTPVAPAATTWKLRPWLTLIVVRQQKGVSLERRSGMPAVLKIASPANPRQELPDLADAAAWAHVQSTLAPTGLSTATLANFRARLICPRKLESDSDYLAAVVPTFEAGRLAGLGLPSSSATTGPAWNVTDAALTTVELPVFLSWTFHTGAGGDFETLARRIHAVSPADPELGRASLAVSDPSGHVPVTLTSTFQGALRAPSGSGSGAAPSTWKDPLKAWLNEGASPPTVPAVAPANYKPETDDPVLAPPMFGALARGRTTVPESTELQWMNGVNLEPHLRAAAGLGAATVRRAQEELMAAAWEQAEAAKAAENQLHATQLGVAAGRRVARKLSALPSGTRVQVLKRQHAFVVGSTGTVAQDLQSSDVPKVLSGHATLRATRRGGVLARRWPGATRLGEAVSGTLVAATASRGALKGALSYQVRVAPAETMVTDPTLQAIPDSMWAKVSTTSATARTASPASSARTAVTTAAVPWGNVAVATDVTTGRSSSAQMATWLGGRTVSTTTSSAGTDVSGVATVLAKGLDPSPHLRSLLSARVPGLSAVVASALPARLDVPLSFPDPLVWKLTELGRDYVMPGAGAITDDSVQQVQPNNTFVAAYLLGANHEMARELVWREFPTSPSRTFFRQFWDGGEGAPVDIPDVSAWTNASLAAQVSGLTTGGAALSVFAIRATLLRRFPNTRIYLKAGSWSQSNSKWTVQPGTADPVEAVLGGSLGPDLVYLGFPLASVDVYGERAKAINTAKPGYYLVFEEPEGEPRFGIAPGRAPATLTTWDDLNWSCLVGGVTATFADSRARLSNATGAIEGATWGTNAAHMARITWRRPFRLLIHGDQILPEPA